MLSFFRFVSLSGMYQRMFPDLKVDLEAELERYKKLAELIRPLALDATTYLHTALKNGKRVTIDFFLLTFLIHINNNSKLLN